MFCRPSHPTGSPIKRQCTPEKPVTAQFEALKSTEPQRDKTPRAATGDSFEVVISPDSHQSARTPGQSSCLSISTQEDKHFGPVLLTCLVYHVR